jgi:hypothetical protein
MAVRRSLRAVAWLLDRGTTRRRRKVAARRRAKILERDPAWWALNNQPLLQAPPRTRVAPRSDVLPARQPPPPRAGAWTLYRYYDAGDRLLYVGITGQGHWRAGQHAAMAAWWPLVARATFEHFDSEPAARAAEQEQIATLDPLYNIAGRRHA